MIQGDKNMGEDREGRAAALLPILIFLLIFLGSGFITGDFYSMPAIVALLIALLAVLVQNRELGFSETGNLGGHHHSLAPIAAGISQKTGFSMAVCAGAVVGGAMFGDNLSMISDTTIAAVKTQGCEMKDKFRENFLIVLPAAIVTILLFLVLGKDASFQIQGSLDYSLLRVMLYLVVLAGALAGVNVFLVLMTGTVLSLIAGVATGAFGVGEMFTHVGEGITVPYCFYPILMGVSGLIFIFIKKRHGKVLI